MAIKECLRSNDYGLIEKENWYFGKGHRNFWGMEKQYGWNREEEEIRTLEILQKSLDKTINRHDCYLKLVETDANSKNLEIRANKQGIKMLISDLIKIYVNRSDISINLNSNSRFLIDKIFSVDSSFNIDALKLSEDINNTDWVHDFVDNLIDKKEEG